MIEYRVVRQDDLNTLTKDVNELIKEGWMPQGGVVIDFNTMVVKNEYSGRIEFNCKQYMQTMIRGTEEEIEKMRRW